MGKAKSAEHTKKLITFLDVSWMVTDYIRRQCDDNFGVGNELPTDDVNGRVITR